MIRSLKKIYSKKNDVDLEKYEIDRERIIEALEQSIKNN